MKNPNPATNCSNFVQILRYRCKQEADTIVYEYPGEGSGQPLTLTYGRLHAIATNIALTLLQSCKKGDRALMMYSPGLDFVSAFFGCLYAGIIPVPVYPPRKNQKLNRLRSIISDADVRIVLTTADHTAVAKPLFGEDEQLKSILWLETDSVLPGTKEPGSALPHIGADDIAFLQYTSGSTGDPKGVVITHRNLMNNEAIIATVAEHDKEGCAIVSWLPHFHDMGLIACVLQAVYAGIPLTLLSPSAFLQKPVTWFRAITKSRATFSGAPNFAYDLCVDAIKDEELEGIDLSSWRIAFNGSEPVQAATMDRFTKRFGKYGFKKEVFYPCYGMAESCLFISGGSIHQVSRRLTVNKEALKKGLIQPQEEQAGGSEIVSCGQSFLEHEIRIVDPVTKACRPQNEVGEIWLRGQSVGKGYWNKPELNEHAFNAFTSDTGQGPFLRTGDLGFYNQSDLFITGRLKDMLIIWGQNYYPQDLEQSVDGCHEAMMKNNTVVFSVENEGEERVVLVHGVKRAFVNGLDAGPVFNAIKTRIANEHGLGVYDIVLVKPTGILKTSSGKLQRQANKQAYLTGGFEVLASLRGRVSASGNTVIPTRTEIEKKLKQIGEDLLGIEQLSIFDSFFDVGGSSVLAAQFCEKVSAELNIAVPITDLFTYPTISDLAAYLLKSNSAPENKSAQPSASASLKYEPIAIVGMAGSFPDAADIDQFWKNISNGLETIHHFSDEELAKAGVSKAEIDHPLYVKSGILLDGIRSFDAGFFGISPREAEISDPQHRKLMECAYQALEHAGYGNPADKNVGVFAGVGENIYLHYHIAPRTEIIKSMGKMAVTFANGKDYVATRISFKLNLKGPSINVNTACSSSLVGIHQACLSLMNGECSMALAGSAGFAQIEAEGYMYDEGGIHSPDGYCRPFDKEAKGTRTGSGVAMLVLKKLDAAIADGDHIHAIIKGSAINNDGHDKAGYTSPSVEGQTRVIKSALAVSNIDPTTIRYVESHGTGTLLGDPIEIEGLKRAFNITGRTDSCALGSVKANIGHLYPAAGIAGLIKTVEAMKHKKLPPSINYNEANPHINFRETPFYVNTQLKPWEKEQHPRRAGINSFGIGGTNAHVILEEAPLPVKGHSHRKPQLVLLSAKTASSLERMAGNFYAYLEQFPNASLPDVAYTLQVGRELHAHRRFLVAESAEQLMLELEGAGPQPNTVHQTNEHRKELVFMFPGQGAQYVNMTRELYPQEPVFKATLDTCADLLLPLLGLDIRSLLYPGTESEKASEQLKQTCITQPALFAVEYSLASLFGSWGLKPSLMIGHSIGEYAAACLAGVFSLEDAIRIVAARGRLIQSVEKGDMLSVQCTANDIAQKAEALNCSLAAINSPQNCVVAGRSEDIASLIKQLDEEGIAHRILETSHAFHSSMMDGILSDFAAELAKANLQPPSVHFISCLSGKPILNHEATDPAYWVRHIREAVNFSAGMEYLLTGEPRVFVELGPGATLCSLARKQKNAKAATFITTVPQVHDLQPGESFLMKAVGQLWQAGLQPEWKGFHAHQQGKRVPLPLYPFERKEYWIGKKDYANAEPAAPSGKMARLEDWFFVPSWHRQIASGLPTIDLAGEKLNYLIFTDDAGIGAGLQQALQKKGQTVVTVSQGAAYAEIGPYAFTINPVAESDYQELYAVLAGRNCIPDKMIHLWSMQTGVEDGTLTAGAFEQRQTLGFDSLLYSVRNITTHRQYDSVRLFVISNNIHSVTGHETVLAANATVLSLCKVVPQEYLNIKISNIDLELPLNGKLSRKLLAGCQQFLLSEISLKTTKPIVAYRGHHRWLQTFERFTPQHKDDTLATISDNKVYVITGGLGNIGLELARTLAQQAKVKLALIRRSAFPGRETWNEWLNSHGEDDYTSQKIRHLRNIEALGAEVLVFAADASNITEMEKVFTDVEKRFGSIHGVIHGAGIIYDSINPIREISLEDRRVHFNPKAHGLLVLEQLLKTRKVDFCMMMSSLSSVLGGPGSLAYAGGNIFMDAFVQNKHNQGDTSWISVNWDWWKFESDNIEKFDDVAAVMSMTPQEGHAIFRQVLSFGKMAQLTVSIVDLNFRIKKWIEFAIDKKPPLDVAVSKDEDPNYVHPENEVQQSIVKMWQLILGVEKIGIRDNFIELGGDSLLATRLLSLIRQEFNIGDSEISLKSFYENPIIENISGIISTQLNARKMKEGFVKIEDNLGLVEEGVI